MKKIVLVDIDHVVANSFWRDDMIGKEGGWDAYHAAAHNDQPVESMVNVVNCLAGVYDVWGLTARPEKWRQLTLTWLVRHGVVMKGLLMRPDRDFRPSPLVKIDIVRKAWSDHKDRVAILIEDRDDVCAVFRAEGIVCLQCHISASQAPSIPFILDSAEGKHAE